MLLGSRIPHHIDILSISPCCTPIGRIDDDRELTIIPGDISNCSIETGY